ncbi:cell division protein DivIVA [Corynebacterium mayonis]|uniref:cell division protein DivIVA n=1 Tax=Corynebacterium mayonis TaxID=3062461 RepID=UPI00314029DE
MSSWILLIVIIALVSVIGFLLSSKIFGRGEELAPMPPSREVIAHNHRALAEGRVADIELEVVHRGYRMDQVDALVEDLLRARGHTRGPEGQKSVD